MPVFSIQVLAPGRLTGGDQLAVSDLGSAHPIVLACTPAAQEQGVEAGMLLSRALGTCPTLDLIDDDAVRIDEAGESFLQRLEAVGAEVEPAEPGRASFDAAPLLRLYGGLAGVVRRVLTACAHAEDIRMGVAGNPFAATVVAAKARPGTCLSLPGERAEEVFARMPLGILPLDPHMRELLRVLGIATCGQLAAIDRAHIADRFGEWGLELWELAHGRDRRRLVPRTPPDQVGASMEFPEEVGNELLLSRALAALLEQACEKVLARGRMARTCTISARLAGGASWRVRKVLRAATADARRIHLGIAHELGGVPAPVQELRVSFDTLAAPAVDQPELERIDAAAERRQQALREGLAHLQQAVGSDSVLQVLELDPESGVPERRAVLVPRGEEAAR